MKNTIRKFLKLESSGGIILIIAAIIAMLIANSPLHALYKSTFHSYIAGLSVEHWINDGLMAIFFMLIGLEVKRELIEGVLNTKEKAIFPAIAALGGMLAPALIYAAFNCTDPIAIRGWAIPAATDIAFSLGVMALLGNRVPISLKVFLLALAIIDDLGAIVIIALFYSSDLSTWALSVAFFATTILFVMNTKNVTKVSLYFIVGGILWLSVLKSGVHATLAGVVLGFVIPLNDKEGHSPLKHLEGVLHPYVAYLILPLFAFANAGISLESVSLDSMASMLPIGIAMGLFIGKPLGVFTASYVAVKTGLAKLPDGIGLNHVFAVSVLCGIGFTMSIFISSLAFVSAPDDFNTYSRLGILMGSTVAAVTGYFLLNRALSKAKTYQLETEA